MTLDGVTYVGACPEGTRRNANGNALSKPAPALHSRNEPGTDSTGTTSYSWVAKRFQ